MANPQTENGYTKIANEIVESLSKIRINGEAWQVLTVIIRKTYGFHKKQDPISLSQFVLATSMRKPNVCRAINKLIQMNIIIKIDNEDITIYQFNKDFDTWKPLSKLITLSKPITTVIKIDNKSLSKLRHTKDIYTKETITKDIASPIQRRETAFKKEDYNEILNCYQTLKGIELKGNEYLPVQQAIKSMFMSGRNKGQIMDCMKFLSNHPKECWQSWTIDTVKKQLPLFLAGKL